jgi:hypothetical protein
VEYNQNLDKQFPRTQRTYIIYGLDPIERKNNVIIGEIIVRGYSIKLDEIEEKLLRGFN